MFVPIGGKFLYKKSFDKYSGFVNTNSIIKFPFVPSGRGNPSLSIICFKLRFILSISFSRSIV